MDNLLGLLRIRIKRGINLAIRDFRSSDPYCVIILGEQRLKTHIIDRDLNPVWNEDLTLSIEDPDMPVQLMVFDHDTFSRDDEMGDAYFDIKAFLETQKMNLESDSVPNGTTLKRIKPSSSNYLSEESCIIWQDGNVVQNILLKLRNVECGEIELELHWIDLPH
ncbi:protein C2-DOMAIN ABA-RELATED 4-like [Rutidosis leptorrhynchoides]|uniref:protein C2-DOMAIN ABA-RELATED 4-like n=1 Tax=Rutidosis leptorrhynchoides TaxID=125765 RepID=UPI003A9903F8